MKPSPAELARRGIYTFDTLAESLEDEISFVIDGLLVEGSVNLLAGDSGIGKTPLCVTIALAIAAGIPFLGMPVPKPRTVLYCDAESSRLAFHRIVQRVAHHMGLSQVPDTFHVWSPNWDSTQQGIDYASGLWRTCDGSGVEPDVVFIDPLRVFFPEADLKRDVALKHLTRMRRLGGGKVTWLIVHHTRKPSNKQEEKPKPIDESPHAWFHEVAGQHAIINHVDTRLGVEATPLKDASEMTMGGFVRMLGPITPLYLARTYDDEGDPLGYIRASSLDLLSPDYQGAYHQLPGGGTLFTFGEASRTLGKSDAAAGKFLKRLLALGIVKKVEGHGYIKVTT